MKIAVVYSPFASPASPPYSILNIYSFLKANTVHEIDIIDLNLLFHKRAFPQYFEFFKDMGRWDSYDRVWKDYRSSSEKVYSECNKNVQKGQRPLLYDELLLVVNRGGYDAVIFSLVYSSQVFYSYAMMDGIAAKIFAGGPAANKKISERATVLAEPAKLLSYLNAEDKGVLRYPLDFNGLDLDGYMSPSPVIPVKSSVSCPYKACSFCSHHEGRGYLEYPLGLVAESIILSGEKNFLFIDDMITPKRLEELSLVLAPLKVNWACQLKPGKDFSKELLNRLAKCGLSMIIWGIESGNDRVLRLMRKGSDRNTNSSLLRQSHEAGIRNVVYMMFGFPTETRDEFLDSISFLKENSGFIDLVSTSVFGLQKMTKIYENPIEYGISDIKETKRRMLDPKITYQTRDGLSIEETRKLRSSHIKMIEKISRYPRGMNLFREHMLIYYPKHNPQ